MYRNVKILKEKPTFVKINIKKDITFIYRDHLADKIILSKPIHQ